MIYEIEKTSRRIRRPRWHQGGDRGGGRPAARKGRPSWPGAGAAEDTGRLEGCGEQGAADAEAARRLAEVKIESCIKAIKMPSPSACEVVVLPSGATLVQRAGVGGWHSVNLARRLRVLR